MNAATVMMKIVMMLMSTHAFRVIYSVWSRPVFRRCVIRAFVAHEARLGLDHGANTSLSCISTKSGRLKKSSVGTWHSLFALAMCRTFRFVSNAELIKNKIMFIFYLAA